MAAPMELHGLHVPEPTYCKIKHDMKPKLGARLYHLQTCLSATIASERQHGKILSESKLLWIMIYKRTGQLRREKSLQLLKRVQACLKRVRLFGKIFKISNDLFKDIRSALTEMKEKGFTYLPSQQTWTYLLYLQMLYTQLMEATAAYCVAAFEHLSCQLATGMLIPQMLVFMGITARIWFLSRSMTERMQSFYYQIQLERKHFERTQSDWKDPELPPALHLLSDEIVSSDLKKRLSAACKTSAKESVNAAENVDSIQPQDKAVINYDFPSSHEEEDLGVPVVLKRKRSPDLAVHSKRSKSDSNGPDFSKKKKKKKKKKAKKYLEVSSAALAPSELSKVENMSGSTIPTVLKKKQKKKLTVPQKQSLANKTQGHVSESDGISQSVSQNLPTQKEEETEVNVVEVHYKKKKKMILQKDPTSKHTVPSGDGRNQKAHAQFSKQKQKKSKTEAKTVTKWKYVNHQILGKKRAS